MGDDPQLMRKGLKISVLTRDAARRVGYSLTLALALCAPATNVHADDDSLLASFQRPPLSAAPRVWWHWMNGNITESGIRADLEWMHQVGIGGAQIFQGDLFTPQIVPAPLSYRSDGWKSAVQAASDDAQRLGIDLTITSTPGWSSAGGPWVKPQDAMKKLVWSQTTLSGGSRFRGSLPQPPDTSGPFQGISTGATSPGYTDKMPHFYRDSVVVAYRDTSRPISMPRQAYTAEGPIDAGKLTDGDFQTGVALALPNATDSWLEYRFDLPQRVSAITVGIPVLQGFGSPSPPLALLQASDDGVQFRAVATLSTTTSAVRSASFAAVTAKVFRVLLTHDPATSFREAMALPPGVVPIPLGEAPSTCLVTEVQLYGDARVHAFAEKAGFATAGNFYDYDTPNAAVTRATQLVDVIDLTRLMKSDGQLDWKAPATGTWQILRMGYSLTGQQNHPAPKEATGFEVDKLNGRAVDRYFNAYLADYQGVLASKPSAIDSMLTDSIESGPQNWTDDFLQQFRRLRGYDPVPWLPAMTGVVIQSAADSDRFLWDVRKTIAELYASEYYTHSAAVAHSHGLTYYAEALEDHRPQLGDDMQMRRAADIPMGAMWVYPMGQNPGATYVADLQGAASVAHIFGKPLVAAESMTAFGHPWGFAPRDLKHVADTELALGVNRFAIHESTHQPLDDRKPGFSLSPLLGQYLNRNETWAPFAGAWISYLTRSSFLLQQGKPHAQIAYFFGEEGPLTSVFGDHPQDDVPAGYSFDFVDADALTSCFAADEAGVSTCGGSHYSLIYLGGTSRRMTQAVVTKLTELVNAGATLVGLRPSSSPSLADDPAAFKRGVETLFGRQEAPGRRRRVGRGEVLESPLTGALETLGVGPDWAWTGAHGDQLRVLQRELADGQMFFVTNQSGQSLAGSLSLKASGKRPELWSAEGSIPVPVSYEIRDDRTLLPLHLEADESVFVMLRKPAKGGGEQFVERPVKLLSTLPETWRVEFATDAGAQTLNWTQLISWPDSASSDIRYFSGTATYRTELAVSATWLKQDRNIYLDLGQVDDLAAVSVNGRDVGITWHAPYRLEISSFLKPGRNDLAVKVTNLWVNRLIGDAQPWRKPHTFTNGPTYTADAPLLASGLLGPVTLQTQQKAPAIH